MNQKFKIQNLKVPVRELQTIESSSSCSSSIRSHPNSFQASGGSTKASEFGLFQEFGHSIFPVPQDSRLHPPPSTTDTPLPPPVHTTADLDAFIPPSRSHHQQEESSKQTREQGRRSKRGLHLQRLDFGKKKQ